LLQINLNSANLLTKMINDVSLAVIKLKLTFLEAPLLGLFEPGYAESFASKVARYLYSI